MAERGKNGNRGGTAGMRSHEGARAINAGVIN